MQLGKNKDLDQAFLNASNGIIEAAKSEKSLQREITLAVLVIILASVFKISKVELILVLISISLVILAEFVNTAVELCIDMTTKKFNMYAKKAKDVAAGGVIVTMGFAGLVGAMVFYEKVLEVVQKVLNKTALQEDYIKFAIIVIPLVLITIYLIINMIRGMKLAYPIVSIIATTIAVVVGAELYIVAIVGTITLISTLMYAKYITNRDKVVVTEKLEDHYKYKKEETEK